VAVLDSARIRLRHDVLPLACLAIAAGVALAVGGLAAPSGDAPSHLFQTWLFRHGGFEVWNNYWYAGRYEFVNYSVLYYALAAQLGQLGVLVPAAGVLGGSFAVVCRREWGDASRGPSLAFAATAPFIMMVAGVYPFLGGAASGLVALALVQRGRLITFGVALFATLAFSPLAFALLCALLAGALLGHGEPRMALRRHKLALGLVLVVFLTGVLAQRAFPTQGWYPYDLTDAAIVLVFSLVGLWVTGTSSRARSLRMLFAAYLALNLVAFLLKGPIGSNPNRLFAIAGAPMLWLAANVGPRRSRLVVFPILAAAVALQVGPWVRDAYSAWNNPAAKAAYWKPAISFVNDHRSQIAGYRVEAVATWGHWDAYYIAHQQVPLARGWFRQDDFPLNRPLYDRHLSAVTYQHWLRSLGVRYVLLPDAPLDFSSAGEARLLRSGQSGLAVVARTSHWTFFELPAATPIASAPAGRTARLIYLEQQQVELWASGPGRYVVRVRYSPYWTALPSDACLSPTADGMTAVTLLTPGFVRLAIAPDASSLASTAASNDANSC
jgi:hypothetical protein